MKVVLGLGNPGAKYVRTRHNAGFLALDAVFEKNRLQWNHLGELQIVVNEQKILLDVKESASGDGIDRTLLVKPLTYMNLSGWGALAVIQKWQVDIKDMLVVCDDVHLELGKIRFRNSGSSGGQNGIQSVMDALQTDQFDRLRIGIGPKVESMSLSDFVLSPFNPGEEELLNQTIQKSADAVMHWMQSGIQDAMNVYN